MELKGKSLRILNGLMSILNGLMLNLKQNFNIWVGLCHRLFTAKPSQGWKLLLRQFFYLKKI